MRSAVRLLTMGVLLALFAGVLLLAGLSVATGRDPLDVAIATTEFGAGSLLRHLERRLEGHPRLEQWLVPGLRFVQRHVERPVPTAELETVNAKGQQIQGVAAVRWGGGVVLDGLVTGAPSDASHSPSRVVLVQSAAELDQAVADADAGTVIDVMPGQYRVTRSLWTKRGGLARNPITVRAGRPGLVRLDFAVQQGFVVAHPHWHFENLQIRGVCSDHSTCEHAFHIVGNGHHAVIRNNHLSNFNAHVKVNGEDGRFPDDGLLQFNTLDNDAVRQTGNPVSPVDIVAASRWRVLDNRVSNFVRTNRHPTYGIFMKGAGEGGRIERNLVLCTTSDLSRMGTRIGISLGGGGTSPSACRDKVCRFEHAAGRVSNNVVAFCNESGVDVNRSIGADVQHNTLINTAGISVRGAPAVTSLRANVSDGRILVRRESTAFQLENARIDASDYASADRLRFDWLDNLPRVSTAKEASPDFCGQPREQSDVVGAMALNSPCIRRSSR